MFDISAEAENLMVTLGYSEQEWGWVVDDYLENNEQLEYNGIPIFNTLEEYLISKIVWINSIKQSNERIAA